MKKKEGFGPLFYFASNEHDHVCYNGPLVTYSCLYIKLSFLKQFLFEAIFV